MLTIGAQHRRERAADIEDAVEVGLELRTQRTFAVLAEQAAAIERNAGIVDDDVHVLAQRGGRGCVGGGGDIELDRHHAGQGDGSGITGGGIHLGRAGGQQRFGISRAEAAVGAGYQGDFSLDVHVLGSHRRLGVSRSKKSRRGYLHDGHHTI
jgi:hypothetical protein